ncbi:MAG: hypothetical protein H6624_19285 [Bdellovibrionaceae bacterium]|nr:hypothetical protein [Bdellovibrionales bacterium]MCB9086493.1 hypothetical protein [Pseudobdellovibrionaceae bacterium]
MKNLMAIALILTCFLATTLMVGCAPSGNDKKARIRKGRGLMNKTTPQGQKQTPQPAAAGATTTPAGATGTQPVATSPTAGVTTDPAATAMTNLAGADNSADKQIDEIIADLNSSSIPQIHIKDIPVGTYSLSRVVSTIIHTSNSYRALLSAKVKMVGDPAKPGLEREVFLANNKSHGSPSPLSAAAVIPFELTKEGDYQLKFNQTFYYNMEVPSGDVGNILVHEGPPATAAQPLLALDTTFLDVTSNAYVGQANTPEKGYRVFIRSSGNGEIRFLIENPANSAEGYRSIVLIFTKSAETTPGTDT